MKTLERTLGLPYVIAISIGAMLGSGVFVLPGLASAKTGPSVWLAYLFAGVCVVPAALSKSEMATAMPTSGGTYVYVDRAFGPLVGTISGLGLWLSLLLKSSFALLGFGAYLQALGVDVSGDLRPVALVLLAAICVLNLIGIRKVGKVMLGVVIVSLAGLAILVVLALVRHPTTPAEHFFTESGIGFLEASAFVFVSYAGVTKIAAVAEEVKDPDRNLPRGILYSLAAVGLLYGAIVLMLVDHLPLAALGEDVRPIHSLAVRLAGPAVGAVFAVLGVLTMASMANAGLLAASRFPFAMSRDHLLPPALHRVHARFRTPSVSIVATCAVMALVIAFMDVEKIAKLASAFVILTFALECLTIVILREGGSTWYRPSYRSPLYPAVQLFGIVSGLVLLVALGLPSVLAVVAVIVPGALLYAFYGRSRTDRSGLVEKFVRRDDDALPSAPVAEQYDAVVVVALFGWERSPEVVVEAGMALAAGSRIHVVHLTEVGEQVLLDETAADPPQLRALRRRIEAMARAAGADLDFETIVCRDLAPTIHEISTRTHCRWLVTAWRGRRSRDRFMFLNPLGRHIHRLEANLALLRDAGVRFIQRILVFPEPGPDDALVVATADHLAVLEDGELTFVAVVPAAADDASVARRTAYLDALRTTCAAPTRSIVLRADDPVAALVEAGASHDLLVTSASPPRTWRERLRGSTKDRLMEGAVCSVLSLKTPRGRTHQLPGRAGAPVLPRPDCTEAALFVADKAALFAHLGIAFAARVPALDAAAVTRALHEREHAQGTGVGNGVALPHATIDAAPRTVLGVFELAAPLDYDAADGVGVRHVFATVGPPGDRQTHLDLLAGVARLVLHTDLLVRLAAAHTTADVSAALDAAGSDLGRAEPAG